MGLSELMDAVLGIINNALLPIAFSLCLLYFFWGIAKYIRNAGDEKAIEQGKETMIWGVIALFVVFSIWGIIRFIGGEFGIDPITNIQIDNN